MPSLSPNLSPIMEPAELQPLLDDSTVLVVDMSSPDSYASAHIPNAVNLAYGSIVQPQPPAGGMLPDMDHLSEVLSSIGLQQNQAVVAYDAEQGGRAARLLWTLDALGHNDLALLNGGLRAWYAAGLPISQITPDIQTSQYQAKLVRPEVIADKAYIQDNLQNKEIILLDSRSPAEYAGTDVRAARGGHIPGAVNLNWVECMNTDDNLRLKNQDELRTLMEVRQIQPQHEVITYCQTHHRSAYTYWVLKALGYEKIRGYAGSWSEWGNDPDTPIDS